MRHWLVEQTRPGWPIPGPRVVSDIETANEHHRDDRFRVRGPFVHEADADPGHVYIVNVSDLTDDQPDRELLPTHARVRIVE